MRRLLTLVAALGFASTLLGCHCTCGICDCDRNYDPCNYYAPCDHAVLPAPIGAVPTGSATLPAPTVTGGQSMQKVIEK